MQIFSIFKANTIRSDESEFIWKPMRGCLGNGRYRSVIEVLGTSECEVNSYCGLFVKWTMHIYSKDLYDKKKDKVAFPHHFSVTTFPSVTV